jgi:inorganic pyrophosphatase
MYDSIVESLIEIAETREEQVAIEVDFQFFPSDFVGINGERYIIKLSIDLFVNSSQQLPNAAEEQNSRLLIWHAKSKLYLHAVESYSERQPLYRGTHIGTTLSTRILAAIARRKTPIQASLKKFNDYRKAHLERFAPDQLALPENQPLNYQKFINLSLDDPFWQDVYLFHSQAPWAINGDVRTGIQAILTMERSEEEKKLIAQELTSMMSWAVKHHGSICSKLNDIGKKLLQFFDRYKLSKSFINHLWLFIAQRMVAALNEIDSDENDDTIAETANNDPATQSITSINLGECEEVVKLGLVKHLLDDELTKHNTLLRSWEMDVFDLWKEIHGVTSLTEDPWFLLMNSLQPESSNATESGGDLGSDNIDEDIGSDGMGEDIDPAEVANMLGVDASNNEVM